MAIIVADASLTRVEGPRRLVYTPRGIFNLGIGRGMSIIEQRFKLAGIVGAGLLALALSGCASTGVNVANADSEQLAPVQNGNVQTAALPPIGPNGEVQGATDPNAIPANGDQLSVNGGVQTGGDGLQTLPAVGSIPNSTGRDLSSGLTVEKLLGRWTVVSGQDQCALNLTQTQKTGTGRYRASAPACSLKGMTAVSSWALAGTQVQLFDEGGNIIAALILSGNRFIGTLSGGQGISMVG